MRGRLLSLLRAAKTAIINSHNGAMGPRNFGPISPRRLTGFAHDIARGMEYISEKKVNICHIHQSYYIMTCNCSSFRSYIEILLQEMFCWITMASAKYAILECPLIWKKRNRQNQKLISFDNRVVPNRIGFDSIFIDDHSAMIERLTIASNDPLYLYGGWHRKHYSTMSFLRKRICGPLESFYGK